MLECKKAITKIMVHSKDKWNFGLNATLTARLAIWPVTATTKNVNNISFFIHVDVGAAVEVNVACAMRRNCPKDNVGHVFESSASTVPPPP